MFEVVLVDLCQGFGYFLSFLKNNLQNIWSVLVFYIPLHSLLRNKLTAYEYLKR